MSSIAETPAKAASSASLESWKLHLLALGAALLALGAAFWPDIRTAVIVWWAYPAYSHCFLVLPISAWLIWEKRDELLSDTPSPWPLGLLAAIPFVALWFVGRFATITEFRQFALIGMAEAFILAILGRHIFARIAFPCLYLFFLVPTGQYLIPPLQQITAEFVRVGLNLFSIPYYQDGLMFDLVNGRYEIAEACAGLRFLVATIALGMLFAHLMYRRWHKIALFMLASLVFPIVGNGIRALLTVMVANYTNNEVAAGFDHLVYGWAFAVAIIFTLMFVGSRYRDVEVDAPPAPGHIRATRAMPLLATLAGALALLAVGPAAAFISDRAPSTVSQPALDRVADVPGWPRQVPSGDWAITFIRGAARTQATLARDDQAAPVDIDTMYYIRDRNAFSLLGSLNHFWNVTQWHEIESRISHAPVNGTDVAFHESVLLFGNAKRMVWSVYWIDGRFTVSPLMVRLLEFKSGIVHGHSAAFALSTPITSTNEDARARLAALLAAFPGLSDSLEKAGQAQAD